MPFSARPGKAACATFLGLAMALSTSCSQATNDKTAYQSTGSDNAARKKILAALGSSSALILIGENDSQVDLGLMDEAGLRPAPVSPRPQLFSMLTSSGTNAVISAGGFDGGATTDSFYWIDHGTIRPVINVDKIGDTAFRPSLNPAQQLAGLGLYRAENHADSTYALNIGPINQGTWQPRPILKAKDIGDFSWGPDSQIAVVLGAQLVGRDRLYVIAENGKKRDLGQAECANRVFWGPAKFIAIGWNSEVMSEQTKHCGVPALVDTTTGARKNLPKGWNPMTWSKDNSQLVLTRGSEISLWRPGAPEVTDIMHAPSRIFSVEVINDESNIL